MSRSALKRRAKEARAWLFEACFPLWAERGTSDTGLFEESLTLDHLSEDQLTTRVRVQARQTYVFAEALRLGWQAETARDSVQQGVRTLSSIALRPDGLPGHRLHRDGSGLSDDQADLYDIAFLLFALGEAGDALGEPQTHLAIAETVLDAVDRQMRDRIHGGYAEGLPPPDQRAQNPHMHLLEACLALYAAQPTSALMGRAAELVDLFQTRLTAGPGGLVGEIFSGDWSAPHGEEENRVEPGHQFEWVWLLNRYAALSGDVVPGATRRLYTFAVSTMDQDGHVPLYAHRDGSPLESERRLWSQAEALKAHLSMMQSTKNGDFAKAACRSFDILMDEHLTPEGGWIDHYDADGSILSQSMPASSGYHIVLAFSELIRAFDA